MSAQYNNLVELIPENRPSDERDNLQKETSELISQGAKSADRIFTLLEQKTVLTCEINNPVSKDVACLSVYEQNDSFMNNELCNFFEDYFGKINSQQTA